MGKDFVESRQWEVRLQRYLLSENPWDSHLQQKGEKVQVFSKYTYFQNGDGPDVTGVGKKYI